MKKEMLINVLQPEEIRIAIVEDGVLEELYMERTSHESYVGNIYKGRIVNIEPSIQAAFVDFGVGRNGFLHVSDVEPTYYRHLEQGGRDRDRDRGGRDRDRDSDRRGPRRGGRRPERDERPMPDLPEIPSLDDDETAAYLAEAEDTADVADDMGGRELGRQIFPQEISTPESLDEDSLPPEPGFDEGGFGAGLLDSHVEVPKRAEIEIVVTETEIVEEEDAPLSTEEAAPAGEEGAAEQRGRGRRRGRGRGRGRGKGKRAGDEAAEAPPAGGDAPPPAPEPRAGADDRPFPMSSTEHRTDEGGKGGRPISDEELSFSMTPPAREMNVERVERVEPKPPVIEPAEPFRPREPIANVPDTLDFHADDLPPPRPSSPPPDLDEPVGYREPLDLPDLTEDREQGRNERSFEPDFDDEGFEARPPQRGNGDDRRDDRRGRGGRGGDRDRDRRGGGHGRPSGPGGRSGPGGGRPGFGRPGGGGRPGFGRPKPLIQDIFKRGQEVLVQVIKEGIGTKGPTLSTYISIAGRYLVLMPGLNRIGVSRKIEDEDARRRLRDVLHDLQPPKGLGFIIRTAGLDRNRKELQRDLAYLSRLWQVVVRRIKKLKGPSEIYQESDMIMRTIRDIFTSEIDTIWVDEKNAFDHAQEFLQVVMPRYANRIKHYDGTEPMFHKYGIESEMDRIQRRRLELPMGGSIVIDQTEALVAIDVNSGNFRADNNAEETAYQMNLQAAKEIARQLRLRDLGGVIVNDFIDMREERHRRGVERALREAVERDRARTKILRISQFGIIEMTRQRIRPSLKRSVFQDCPHCHGTGQVKTVESMSIEVMRLLQLAAHRELLQRIEARVHEEVAHYLLNRKRAEIARLEETGAKQFFIQGRSGVAPEFLELTCFDNNNNEVKFMPFDEPPRPPRRR